MNEKRIIEGKTILLNTATNTTFIADDLDEKVQTGSSIHDKNIEWAGELDVAVCRHEYKKIAESLWSLLDDIDTSSDIFNVDPAHPDTLKAFYLNTMKLISKRGEFLESDGYNLSINELREDVQEQPKEIRKISD